MNNEVASASTFEIPEITLSSIQAAASAKLNEANPQDATRVAGTTATEQNAILAQLATQNVSTAPPTVEQKETINPLKDSYTIARLYYNVQQLFNPSNADVINEPKYGSQVYFQSNATDTRPFFYQEYQGPNPDSAKPDNGTGLAKKYYIRLGSLLAFIQSNIIPKSKKGGSLYSKLPIDYTTKDNLAYTNGYQVSIDPNVCLISTEIEQNATITIPNTPLTYVFAKNASKYKRKIGNIQVGQIMNIYVNFEYILGIINNNGDPKNQTSVYTLIETLCNGLSVALGGINTFRPFIDTTTNTLKIIDETALPNRNAILEEVGGRSTVKDPTIQIYGYNYLRDPQTKNITQGYAGFVKDFRFTSKLDPKFAQIISVGATNQGGIVGEDATAFSSLNRGLVNRIEPEISNPPGYSAANTNTVEQTSPENQFKESLVSLEKYLGSIGCDKDNPTIPYLNDSETSSYTNLFTGTVMPYIETKNAITQKKSSGTMGFIPVSVGLTLDGISGLKLLNGIKVDTSYLPSNYPETMLFVISKLAHKVENNIWSTELETIMTPDNTVQADATINIKSRRQQGRNSGNSGNSQDTGPGTGATSLPNGIDLTAGWEEIAKTFLVKKEGFTSTAENDVTKYRLGYGTDKILIDPTKPATPDNIREVKVGDVTTQDAAIKVLKYEIPLRFKPRVVGSGDNKITQAQFDSLSDPAKAALISYAYNVGSLRKDIAQAIKNGDLQAAAKAIQAGPTTGGSKYYPGLRTRRDQEAILFLS